MYDFEKLAAVYGGMGFRVETTGELKDALRQVKKISSQPVIINLILPVFGKTTTLKKVSNELVKGVVHQGE